MFLLPSGISTWPKCKPGVNSSIAAVIKQFTALESIFFFGIYRKSVVAKNDSVNGLIFSIVIVH